MKTIMVRYTTTEAHAVTNEAMIRAVFAELRARLPKGIRYDSYRVGAGATFVHIASLDAPDDNPLTALPSFAAFQERLKDRCVEPPVVSDLSPVGSYRYEA
jgi:hypothetical protein